jgi:hypothetical protein
MDDFPRAEPPRFWIAFSILCITFALAFVMLVFNSVKADAQQQNCVPLERLITDLGEKFKERIEWQGVVNSPQGPIETMLFQSKKGTWTFVTVRGVTACILAAGESGTPIGETGEDA